MPRGILLTEIRMRTRGNINQVKYSLLGLGSNAAGTWGGPLATLLRVAAELERCGIRTVRASNLYRTKPMSRSPQPSYLNAVLLVEAHLAPGHLLRVLKNIERRAGRTHTRFMGPRALDIDILDYGGRRIGWPAKGRERGRLILPHPELAKRPFVLVPLLDVAPGWRHSTLGVNARALLARLTPAARATVGQALDFGAATCDKQPS